MGVLTTIFNTLIILVSIFLICLVLIQRGKGGGLAGAFGGVGGSSAFGTKAGDTFTRITVITASVWMLMAMLLVVMTGRRNASTWAVDAPGSISKELGPSSRGKTKAGAPATAPASSSSRRSAEAPAPADKVPAIPKDTNFPPTPGSTPKTP
ncbi:MAG: preprotein translocase subunit SecG [Planctomycetaceae bacterium]|nr:preprotein translocase subunit SecG [Planctomycetaceae bacterium]